METFVNEQNIFIDNTQDSGNIEVLDVFDDVNDVRGLPIQLISFLIQQKANVPICTAIFSLDFETLYFSSRNIEKIDVDINERKINESELFPYEIFNAKLFVGTNPMLNIQMLSVHIQSDLRLCLIFKNDTEDFVFNKSDFLNLTTREKQIARIVALGKTSVQIAEELNITVNTVKNHRKNIRRKLKITTRAEQMKMNEWVRNNQLI